MISQALELETLSGFLSCDWHDNYSWTCLVGASPWRPGQAARLNLWKNHCGCPLCSSSTYCCPKQFFIKSHPQKALSQDIDQSFFGVRKTNLYSCFSADLQQVVYFFLCLEHIFLFLSHPTVLFLGTRLLSFWISNTLEGKGFSMCGLQNSGGFWDIFRKTTESN